MTMGFVAMVKGTKFVSDEEAEMLYYTILNWR